MKSNPATLEKHRAVLDRQFWARVQKTESCWLWTGAQWAGRRGVSYGKLLRGGKYLSAHRVAWEMADGLIPSGQEVLHQCDVSLCVRRSHLFLGTQADNVADMVAKGRHRGPVSERSRSARLLLSDIPAIREKAQTMTQQAIADEYHVTQTTISRVLRGDTWKAA